MRLVFWNRLPEANNRNKTGVFYLTALAALPILSTSHEPELGITISVRADWVTDFNLEGLFMPLCKGNLLADRVDETDVMDHGCKKHCGENDVLAVRSRQGNSAGGSMSSFTHDIKDHNNSILLGADLLLKYWEDLSEHLSELESKIDLEDRESVNDICTTIPAVIDVIRKSGQRIEEVIDKYREAGKCNRL